MKQQLPHRPTNRYVRRCEIRGCGGPIQYQLVRPPIRGSTGIKVCRKCMEELVAVDGYVYVGPSLEKEAP